MTLSMINFAEHQRTTTYFRDEAILRVRIAYRIMEYLAPDPIFKPTINEFTKELMLKDEFGKAYEYVIEELDCSGINTDLGCSMGSENLKEEGISLMRHLLPLYEKSVKDKKEKRRIALIKELGELDGDQV